MSDIDCHFGMKFVSQKTGLSPHVIRVWENRYQVIQPKREANNRRYYSREDLHKLLLLKELTEAGHNIGQLAKFSIRELEQMSQDLGPKNDLNIIASSKLNSQNSKIDPATYLQECLCHIEKMDERGLKNSLNEALIEYSSLHLIEKILSPLIEEIGHRWEAGTLRMAQEHFGTAAIRNFLSTFCQRHALSAQAPSLIISTPTGHIHEIGAMLAAATAQLAGWQAIYLGPSLPAEEILVAIRKTKAQALALSIVYSGDPKELKQELTLLRELVGKKFPIIAGGRKCSSYQKELKEIDALIFTDIRKFFNFLLNFEVSSSENIAS